jgi:hypothetical protein
MDTMDKMDRNDLRKRFVLFLVGCVGVRLYIAMLAKRASGEVLRLMGILALLPAFGFLYLYFSGSRKTGAEVFGAPIWWNSLRPLHGLLWLLFAIMAIRGDSRAWLVLVVDLVIGLSAFLKHHYDNDSFSKILG